MEKELFDYTRAKVDEIAAAPSASEGTENACQGWKEAIADGDDADSTTLEFLDVISANQTTVDGVIAFLSSDMGKRIYGEEGAAQQVAHEQERKAKGAKFCDCAACRPCHELLAKHGREEADLYL